MVHTLTHFFWYFQLFKYWMLRLRSSNMRWNHSKSWSNMAWRRGELVNYARLERIPFATLTSGQFVAMSYSNNHCRLGCAWSWIIRLSMNSDSQVSQIKCCKMKHLPQHYLPHLTANFAVTKMLSGHLSIPQILLMWLPSCQRHFSMATSIVDLRTSIDEV